ncbi:hypothetical protein PRIPAC_85852, partial [Pristionchus pacificus]|uniref:Uncharacterized protein n=1 Tax=Pristionchus pacificus TaxID=54126 RepID=A0A2A6BSA3_PRIPA
HCAQRTFTCKGTQATIEFSVIQFHKRKDNCEDPESVHSRNKSKRLRAGEVVGSIQDGGTGKATFTVTCSADGTKWESDGLTISGVECSFATLKYNSKGEMQIVLDKYLREGRMTPKYLAPISDGGTGTATYTVTCNMAGTGWTAGGQVITSVQCSATP